MTSRQTPDCSSILVSVLLLHFLLPHHTTTTTTTNTTMSANEDIDKHVLRKYEIMQKLGKGVCREGGHHQGKLAANVVIKGIWYSVEGYRQEDSGDSGPQEDL